MHLIYLRDADPVSTGKHFHPQSWLVRTRSLTSNRTQVTGLGLVVPKRLVKVVTGEIIREEIADDKLTSHHRANKVVSGQLGRPGISDPKAEVD